jgi:hypothetical protein
LPANSESKFVTCAYCHVQARIPDRAWFKLSKKEHVPEKMWLLFQGPSGTRQNLLEKQRHNEEVLGEQERDRKRREAREEAEAVDAVARAKYAAAKEKRRDDERAAEQADRERQKVERKGSERTTAIVVTGLFVAVVVVIGLVQTSKEKARDAEEAAYEKSIPNCTAETPADCMKTAASDLPRNYGPAIEDYETACNAAYTPACDAVEALCQSPKIDIGARLNHYERNCKLQKFDACNVAGNLYVNANGDGLAKDESAASKLFKKSCSGGNQAGCDLLAQSCKRGVKESCPVPPDSGAKRK